MMTMVSFKQLALVGALLLLCNRTQDSAGLVGAQLDDAPGEQEFGLVSSGPQMNFAQSAPGVPSSSQSAYLQPRLYRRQVQYPVQPQQQPQQPPATGGVFNFLSELGPQMQQAKAISSLFSPNTQGQQQPSGGANPLQLMAQLSEMIRSTQDRNARIISETGANVGEQVNQASSSAVQSVQSAQGGIQSALAEIGAGLQRMAANNPNLLPDIKNLYQSVSSKLSSASSSVAQAAQPSALSGSQPLPVPSI